MNNKTCDTYLPLYIIVVIYQITVYVNTKKYLFKYH